jgi:hypothetical protein
MRNFLKTWGPFVVAALAVLAWVWLSMEESEKTTRKNTEWANASCPALLSIGRSSRDTLITMKALPLCNQYVLDNLR